MFYKSPSPGSVLIRAAVVLMVFTTVFAGSFSLLPIGDTRVSAALTFAPPANDNFANAQPMLGVSGVVLGTTVGATKEPLEQNIVGFNGTGSVWYKWQAPFDGRFVFTTSGSEFNTLLGVYSGANLPGIQVAANDDDQELCPISSFPTLSRVSFDAVGGVMYHIAVDSKNGSGGNIKLRWGLSATIRVITTTISFTAPSGASGTSLEGDVCIRFGGFVLSDLPTGGSYTLSIRKEPGDNFAPANDNPSISPLTGNVTLVYFLQTPAYTLSGAVTNLPSNNMTGVTVMCVSLNGGLYSQSADIAIQTFGVTFQCHGMPKNAQYLITPRKLGFAFAPPDLTIMMTGHISIPAFVATAASPHTISGRVTHPNGTAGLGGVPVALTGSQPASTVTGTNGDYSFTVPHGGDYTVTPSQSNFTFTPASRSFSNVTTDQPGDFTAAFVLQLILDDTGQVAALDSMLHTRDPFPVINNANLLNQGLDRNTRVAIFVSNFQLGPGEPASSVVINLVDSNSQSFDIPAEDVRLTSDPAFTQIIFKLPDMLAPGICTLFVKARNLTSNTGSMKIRS